MVVIVHHDYGHGRGEPVIDSLKTNTWKNFLLLDITIGAQQALYISVVMPTMNKYKTSIYKMT